MSAALEVLAPLLTALAIAALHSLWIATLAAALFALGRRLRLWRSPQGGYVAGLLLLLGVCAAVLWVLAVQVQDLGGAILQAGAAIDAGSAALATAADPAPGSLGSALLVIAGAAWLLGMLVSGWRTWRAWRSLRRVVRLAQPLPLLDARLHELAARLGVSQAVRVVCSALDHAPFVLGLLKPVIVLPASTLTGLTPAQLEAVLMHELAHVRRVDLWVNLLQVMLETVLFFHPAVHWLSNQVRQLREECCDDLVVGGGIERPLYARALLQLEQRRQLSQRLAPAAVGGALLSRIDRIVAGPGDDAERAPGSAPLLAVVLFAVVLALGLRWPGLFGVNALDSLAPRVVQAGAARALPLAGVPAALPPHAARPLALSLADVTDPQPAPVAVLDPLARSGPALERAVPLLAVPAIRVDPPAAVPPELALAQPQAPAADAGGDGFVPLHRSTPEFPMAAQRAGSTGRVLLSYGLDSRGLPRSVRVEFASGDVSFVTAAREALRQWRYTSMDALRLGTDRLSQEFNFRLNNQTEEEGGRCDLQTGTRVCRR